MTISSVPEVLDINHIGQSGVAAKRMHTFLTSITSTLGNISSPFSFKGSIAVNTSFPLLAAVQTGWFYTITAAVTDNAGATYTNTSQYFTPGSEIAWNGTNWTEIGSPEVVAVAVATPITVGPKNSVTFVDTATISAGSAVALPAATAAKVGDKIAIYDSTGSAVTYNITVTPNTTNTLDGVNAAIVIARNYGALVIQCVASGAWKVLYKNILPDPVYDATIAVANATGGGTTSALTLALKDIYGVAASKVCVAKIIATATQYAGSSALDASPTFGTATAGSILGSGNGWAVVKTDATGAFACTVTNTSDETLYFTACTSDGGSDSVAAGAVIRGCIPDPATWSA